jgi:hypothetical protein
MLSLVLAEVPGGKRRGWKVLPHQSKATLGVKPAVLHKCAHVQDGHLSYPPQA